MKTKPRVLIVDDEPNIRRILQVAFDKAGYQSMTAEDGHAALGLMAEEAPDCILTDVTMPGMTGYELLRQVKAEYPNTPVVIMTAFGTIEVAVEAMKAGAVDFLLKPFSLDHLTTVVTKALEVRALRDENRQLREELGRR